jgi:recombination protein RecT
MNAVSKLPAVSPLEQFRQEILPPEKANDLWRSLPAHIKPAVFERNLINALMQNPNLLKLAPALVYREVSKAAALGLLLDPQLGEAYLIVAWNGKTQREEPQLRIGYKGMCKLARQAGDVVGIYAHEVCQNDRIECHLGTDKRLVHDPDLFGDRGDIVGYYAVIKFTDGAFDFEPMSVKQCREIRDRSDAWKAFKAEKIKSTPWATDEAEMSKKTALRRLLKRQSQSPELAEAFAIEDDAEYQSGRNVTPPPPPRMIERVSRTESENPAPPESKNPAPPMDVPDPDAPSEQSSTLASLLKEVEAAKDGPVLWDWLQDSGVKERVATLTAAEDKEFGTAVKKRLNRE